MAMKTLKHIAAAGCSLFLLTQCATQDDVANLQRQLRSVNQKVEDVRTNTVGQMQKRQASSVSKLDQVEDETQRIRSSIEENSSQNTQFREQVNQNLAKLQGSVDNTKSSQDAKIAELNQKIAALEEKLSTVSEHYSKAQQERVSEADKKAQAAAQKAEAAKQKAAQASAAAAQPPASSSASQPAGVVKMTPEGKKTKVAAGAAAPAASEPAPAKKTAEPPKKEPAAAAPAPAAEKAAAEKPASSSDPFAAGMNHFKDKKYKDAYKSFEQSLSANPNGGQAAKSLYYMGESLYNQGEYDLAILDYQKVIS
ncbi:MAG: hypothetical protein FWC49_05890, partial [Proteobacteria bacterium]|nr:hypothetical protein [Pseudomonadota bacterium]